jgi:hypothetical protein
LNARQSDEEPVGPRKIFRVNLQEINFGSLTEDVLEKGDLN